MNLSNILHIAFYIIVLISLKHLIKEPGSTLAVVSIGSYFLSVLFAFLGNAGVNLFGSTNYYGTGPVPAEYSRIAWKALGVPFLLLSLVLAYFGQQEMSGQNMVAQWISPYPSITDMQYVPNLHHEFVWSWIMKSDDPPELVYSYYEDKSHYVDWEKAVKGPYIIFTKPNYSLEVSASDKAVSGSYINYTLKKTPD